MAVHIKCDILICGGGLAGLSLLYRAMKAGLWKDELIIVADRSQKQENDRTWSFWKKQKFPFDELISHQWDNLAFFTHDGKKISLDSGSYTYNSIRGIDLYQHIHAYLKQFPNIRFVHAEILEMTSSGDECHMRTPEATYTSRWLFNSVYHQPQVRRDEQYFLQHFKGLKIRTDSTMPSNEAYLMDFRTSQNHGTSFFYTLPLSSNELFIEYTLFSKTVLDPEEYDRQLHIYIRNSLQISEYEILDEEYGIIPMTDHVFRRREGNIIHIGTAGGDTRGSTGYTFINTQKTVGKILDSIRMHGHPFVIKETIGLKQQLYDATLLRVLDEGRYEGHQLFSDLFTHTRAAVVFPFLDAETSLFQDLHIMKSLRIFPFLRAFINAVFNRLKH